MSDLKTRLEKVMNENLEHLRKSNKTATSSEIEYLNFAYAEAFEDLMPITIKLAEALQEIAPSHIPDNHKKLRREALKELNEFLGEK